MSCRVSSSLETSCCFDSMSMVSLGEKNFWEVMENTRESALFLGGGEVRSSVVVYLLVIRQRGLIILML